MDVFSTREKEIIKAIGKKRLSLLDISKIVFKKVKTKPLDESITINNSVKRIIKKCDHHKLTWTLERTLVNNKLMIKRIKN